MNIEQLRELARLYNIQITYEDAAGKKRNASRDALLSALRIRNVGDSDLTRALRHRKREIWKRVVEPVHVVWGKREPLIELYLGRDEDSLEYELLLESGETLEGRLVLGPPEWRDHEFLGKTVRVPHKVPLGYHTLRLRAGDATRETTIIAAPMKAPAPREKSWGVFLPLYAAHTARTREIGDLGDLEAYRAWVAEMGGSIVATLPMLASFSDEDPSPYSPISRLYWNELYLDVERLPEYEKSAAEVPRAPQRIDWPRAARMKRSLIEKMAARFRPDDEFEDFAKRAREYAEFRGDVQYHLYVQYRMAQQMRDAEGLYLDFPLGVNPKGFDAWKYADYFAKQVSVGAPPDLFFTKGQNWGFPPFDPDALRAHRYEYFRDCVRHHVKHAAFLRIDHVMAMHRLFWIPEGGDPKDGFYVRYPEQEMYAVLLLEAHRTGTVIIGEDLGTVPQSVPRTMNKHGLRRLYVVQYEIKPDDPTIRRPRASPASTRTTCPLLPVSGAERTSRTGAGRACSTKRAPERNVRSAIGFDPPSCYCSRRGACYIRRVAIPSRSSRLCSRFSVRVPLKSCLSISRICGSSKSRRTGRGRRSEAGDSGCA